MGFGHYGCWDITVSCLIVDITNRKWFIVYILTRWWIWVQTRGVNGDPLLRYVSSFGRWRQQTAGGLKMGTTKFLRDFGNCYIERWKNVTGHIRFPLSHPLWPCLYLVLFPKYQLFPKIYRARVTRTHPFGFSAITHVLVVVGVKQHTKFEPPNFTHSVERAMIKLCIKLEVSKITRYEDMKSNAKCAN